jgi:hypothetical protein
MLLALALTLAQDTAPAPEPPTSAGPTAAAEPTAEDEAPETAEARSFWDRFRDPTDGAFDVTEYLSRGGFIPFPIIITEPAVGVGGGLALGFIHDQGVEDPWAERPEGAKQSPPSMSAAFGVATSNGTWLVGGAHFGVWKEDTIRYTGALIGGDINLDFFVRDQKFGYSLDSVVLYQDVRFRISDTPLFLGANYRISDSTISFRDTPPPPQIPPTQELVEAGLGAVAYWDSRDNFFTPNRGQEATLQFVDWGRAWGGDSDYESINAWVKSFHPVGAGHVFGFRVSADRSDGEVPFYALPYVKLRGVPILRYQGEVAASTELELRYRVTPRWRLLGFGGVGAAWDDRLGDTGDLWAGGVGFRYLASRPLGMQIGIDVARGPEDTAVYLAVGSGL